MISERSNLHFKSKLLTKPESVLITSEQSAETLIHGEVRVKILASPINPSDLNMLNGTYQHTKSYPYTPGLEACGIVIESGGGLLGKYLLGKHVSCSPTETGDGCWAELMTTSATNCIPLSKKLTIEQGATALVNPLTAIALIEKVKESKSKSFINTAAAGALGKMIIKLAKENNLTPINIVRRKKQVELLTNEGEAYVLNSCEDDFDKNLKETCNKLKPSIALDAIGGEMSDLFLDALPPYGKLIMYATLSQESMKVNSFSLAKTAKTIEGFHLSGWLKNMNKLKLIKTIRTSHKLILKGILSTEIVKSFPLEETNEAIEYYKNNMTEGKVLIKPFEL